MNNGCRKAFIAGILLPLLFFCCFPSIIEAVGHTPEGYVMKQWGKDQGFPALNIRDFAQTRDGYLWFATAKGLIRFDGVQFSTVRYTENLDIEKKKELSPDCLLVDKAGNLWIGSAGYLTRYNPQTGEFAFFTKEDGMTGHRLNCMIEDARGNIWLGFMVSYVNRMTIDKMNGKKYTFAPFNQQNGLEGKKIVSILEDSKGNILVATFEKGVFQFRDGRFNKFHIPHLDSHFFIYEMYEDKKGTLWLGTDRGLVRFKNSENHGTDVIVFDTTHGLLHQCVYDLIEDRDGILWVTTFSGLNFLKSSENFQSGNVFFKKFWEKQPTTSLFEDKENNVWFSTGDLGLRQIKQATFFAYTPSWLSEHLGREVIYSVYQNRRGELWFGTRGKLFKAIGTELIEEIVLPKASNSYITAIHEDTEGNLWVGTVGKGLFLRPAGETGTIHFTNAQGLADNHLISIFEDSNHNLWFGTYDGLSRYRDGSFKTLKTKDGISGKFVNNIYENKHHDILVASNKGIFVMEKGDLNRTHRDHYLPDIPVSCILEEKKNDVYWIATHGAGLKLFQDGKITSFTTTEGMDSNFIYQLLEDHRGNLWMTSDNGILRVKKNQLLKFAEKEIGDADKVDCTAFGIPDGLESTGFLNVFSRNSALKKQDGQLWFVITRGVATVQPDEIRMDKSPPNVIIESVIIDDKPLKVLPGAKINDIQKQEYHDLTFYFTAPTFLSPEKMKFKYCLEGIDGDWLFLPPGAERKAVYKDISPGTYTFKVIACNGDGVWNWVGDSITLRLKSAFYETLIFQILAIILFIGLGFVMYFIYKKRFNYRTARSKTSPLPIRYVEECVKKLTYLLEIEKLYRDENISVQKVAEKISIAPHLLSRILNETLKKSFPDLINSYRIEEVKKVLENPKEKKRKILEVAFEAGFNTKAAFNHAFKKHTRMTPSQFREKALQ